MIRITVILSILGVIGGLGALISMLINQDTFGYPGSQAYQVYELFNRGMGFALVLEACALIAFASGYRSTMHRGGKIALYVAIGSWLAMAVGTAAEFWLYSDLPYGEANMRQVSFGLFSLSSLVLGISLLFVGRSLLRSQIVPRYFSIIVMTYLLFDITFFIFVQSPFLAPALLSIFLGGHILVWEWAGRKSARQAVD
jgi:hypothetical protein